MRERSGPYRHTYQGDGPGYSELGKYYPAVRAARAVSARYYFLGGPSLESRSNRALSGLFKCA